jgi:hypothetical protein
MLVVHIIMLSGLGGFVRRILRNGMFPWECDVIFIIEDDLLARDNNFQLFDSISRVIITNDNNSLIYPRMVLSDDNGKHEFTDSHLYVGHVWHVW